MMADSKVEEESILLAAVTLVVSVILVLFCIAAGWFVMWKLFLSRFQFITELLQSDKDIVRQNKRMKARRD